MRFDRLCNWVMGAVGESAEIMEHLKKVVFHDHPIDTELIEEEVGDALWYLAILCEECGISLGEAARKNIAKLTKRYPNGFSEADSINRAEYVPQGCTAEVVDLLDKEKGE